ncbi:MAG: hypothetical protein JNL11_13785 [Bdellovibrionaceae bacterium]|nr:hypothetical protein [Pseudobdellovibrionaceae bacterium]
MNLSFRFSNSILDLLTLVLFGVFLLAHVPQSALAQSKDSKLDYQTEGTTSILSHFVHHGLSQTNKDPSLQTSILIPVGPQFRIGLWGSNVNYTGLDNHILIKIPVELKLEFNKDVHLTIGYSANQYFKSNTRNGNTTRLQLNVFEYLVIHEIESNWEGTDTKSKYFAFNKTFKLGNDFSWENQLGYTAIEVENLQNYFDLMSSISGKANKLIYKFTVTATSNPGQFNGAGDIFGIFSLGFGF